MFINDTRFGLRSAMTSLVAVCTSLFLLGCGDEGSDSKGPLTMVSGTSESSASAGLTNHAPTIDAIQLRPARPVPGRKVHATAVVSDPNGDRSIIEYVWQTDRGEHLGKGNTLDTTGLRSGDRLELVITATDTAGAQAMATHAFRIEHPGTAISLVAIDQRDGTKPGATLAAVVELVDDESRNARTVLEWKVNGESVGTDEELDTSPFAPGDVVILRARLQGTGVMRTPVASTPLILSRGGAPEILSTPLAGIEGGQFRYQINAHSPVSSAELRYGLISGPEGMVVDEKTGLVQWQPATDQFGRFTIEVSATDQWGSGVAQSFVIESAPPTAPAAPAQ